jgi:two-component system cell cycle response regulator
MLPLVSEGKPRRRTSRIGRTERLPDEDSTRREAAEERGAPRPVLVVIAGPDLGLRATVQGGSLLVGRSPEANLPLADPRVSYEHCRVEDRGDGWRVVDLGSTNGTRVGGRRIEAQPLAPGDKIEVGGSVLRFEIQDPKDQAYDAMVQRLIDLDDLTGLLQRRRFDHELVRSIESARGAGQPLGLLVMDLDGLKAINDTHGHAYGAHSIAEAGRLIGASLPGEALAARFGGDEFVAAVPGLDAPAALALADHIVHRVREHRFDRDGLALRLGISIGVAAFPDHADDAEALFRRADEAMYAAKRSGKGCARLHGV